MFITVDDSPQVLFAVHLYSPACALEMSVMFNGFPSIRSPDVMFVHTTVGLGIPAVTLQNTSTLLFSVTFLFSSCSTDAATEKKSKQSNVCEKHVGTHITVHQLHCGLYYIT